VQIPRATSPASGLAHLRRRRGDGRLQSGRAGRPGAL